MNRNILAATLCIATLAVTGFWIAVDNPSEDPILQPIVHKTGTTTPLIFVPPPDETVAESWGSIYGTVWLGPICPVERDPPEPGCADKPYATRLALVTRDGSRVIKEFTSNAEGKFLVDAPPGTYSIRSTGITRTLPYCSSREAIVVPVNDSVQADVSCDSGIR